MNERYLFRAKRLDNGEWVQGAYASTSFWGNDVIIEQPPDRSGFFHVSRYPIPIDPATVGQCTGLLDKNGRLIFEGDVASNGKRNGAVTWGDTGWCLCFPEGDSDSFDWYGGDGTVDLEVVGNIHEGGGSDT